MSAGPSTTVHAALAAGLKAQGVGTLFGLLGDANLFLADAFVRAQGGRFVPATHEAAAVQMGLGHADATREAAAVTITHGPAVTNALTSLVAGVKSTLPLVLLAGDTPARDPNHPQAVPQRMLAETLGVGFVQLRSPATACEDLHTAFRRARAERRPVMLNMPVEFMWEQTTVTPPPRALPPTPVLPADEGPLEEAVGIIAAARRPLVLAGRGALHAREALVRLADRIGAPLATSLKGSALFAGHPYNLGVCGTLSTPAAAEAIGAADCIVSFGAGLNRFTTGRGAYVQGKRLVQVDADPLQLGRRRAPDAALLGDPALVAERLLHWLDAAEIPSSRSTDTLDPAALRAPHPVPSPAVAPGTVDLTEALIRIDRAVPQSRVFVTDGGRFMGAAWTRIGVERPEDIVLTVSAGSIGMGMGHAIGAAVARPGQPTLLVTGDGGFMLQGLTDLPTAVREALDLIVVICNDQAYGAEYVQMTDRQMDPAISTFNWPPLAEAARALGCEAVRVTGPEGLEAAEAAIATRTRPLVIELMLDVAQVPRLQL